MDERIIERDPENGQIREAGLSSEEARRMAEIRWSRERNYSDDLTALLGEAGFSDPSLAPTHLKLLAEQAAAGGARSVQAVVQFMRATREEQADPDSGGWDFSHGPCPVCGQYNLHIPSESLQKILEILSKIIGERAREK